MKNKKNEQIKHKNNMLTNSVSGDMILGDKLLKELEKEKKNYTDFNLNESYLLKL